MNNTEKEERRMVIELWRPFNELGDLERRMEEMTRYPLMTLGHPLSWWRIPTEERAWIPALEIYEKEDKFVVRAEVPGMNEDEIDISVFGDTLTIRGERKTESEVKEEDYRRSEMHYGRFSRTVTLASGVQAGKVEASYDNGVLEITLPKAVETKPKKIAIKAKENGTKVKTRTRAKTKAKVKAKTK